MFTNKYFYAGLAGVLILVVALGSYFLFFKQEEIVEEVIEEIVSYPVEKNIGSSVEGLPIESFTYGDGPNKVLFVGGIHGGYEWNSVYLMHRLMDYLDANEDFIPANVSLTIIPVLNPDGLKKVIGTAGRFDPATTPAVKETESGRFNANSVDLNRNFDCKWQPESKWRSQTVSAGAEVFSEPEARALRDFVLANNPKSVIFWHSASNAIYASRCEEEISQGTRDIMNAYAQASGYQTFDSFDHYEITGDAGDWLASVGIPSIAVEMKTHETIEWEKELAGMKAVLNYHNR